MLLLLAIIALAALLGSDPALDIPNEPEIEPEPNKRIKTPTKPNKD
jgi:hypothetical protein